MAGSTRASAARAAKNHKSKTSQDLFPSKLSNLPPTPSPTATNHSTVTKTSKAATPARKRKRGAAVKLEEDINDLPHNLGKRVTKETAAADAKNTPAGRRSKRVATRQPPQAGPAEEAALADDVTSPKKKRGTAKANPYGIVLGEDPFPDWPHPTPEECQKVTDLLSELHGVVVAPTTIPVPSITVSGCGEVPSVLDALIRTVLSAATTGTNSARAFQGLVAEFGLIDKGIGKGSVDWDRVRRASHAQVFAAIKSGGLADMKSKSIKAILDMVFAENQERREGLVKAAEGNDKAAPVGAENEDAKQRAAEVSRADQHVLSLDHYHSMSTADAFHGLVRYPGIGVKTASCVLLFCLQRPSFAVDTHVFRLCKWLGWVPPSRATPNLTFAHLDVRIPDALKYPLHQLFIRHGKTCPRCRAATGQSSEGWARGCPIDHLVTRTGARKDGSGKMVRKQSKKSKNGKKSTKARAENNSSEASAGRQDEPEEDTDVESAEEEEGE
ncbi:MAG: hypothetical protein M1838_002036 [Thelocarpon superellum]|nr:MAG: hypothetical protein M1838_002036 [Thelocarpon superellum]